jgi:outer membrane protein
MKSLTVIFTYALATALSLPAQEIAIATVDMTRLYNEYYKTSEANSKLQGSVEKAKVEAEDLVKQGQELVDEYKEVLERSKNPALTEEAQAKAATDADGLLQGIREKEQEVQQFQLATQRSLQQRQRTYRDLFMDEIKKVALEVADDNGRNFVLDSSGITAVGVPVILYSDPKWDITDEVLEKINADAPEEE